MERLIAENSKPARLAYTVEEFATAAHISKPIALDLVHAEGFPALRVGRRWLIPCKAVERWLEENIGREF